MLYLSTIFFENGFGSHFFISLHALANISISSIFFYHAFFKYGVSGGSPETLGLEISLINATYTLFALTCLSLFYRIFKRKKSHQQYLVFLSYQLRYLANFLAPYLFFDMLSNCSTFLPIPLVGVYKYTFFTLSTMLNTYPMFFLGKRMLGLRFLNLRKDVESKEKFNFLSQFKDILEQLSYATALKELAHLNQTFFQAAFNIPLGRTRLFIRKTDAEKEDHGYYGIANITAKVENFISKSDNYAIMQVLNSSKIFIRDEIDFSHFYEGDALKQRNS